MTAQVKISVLMAVYNTDFSLVKRAIDSVLNQDFQNFELIIMDDGSHNDVQNRILDYVKKHENKIQYIRHSNRGQAKSINRGVLNTVGEFITIIDSDDEYKPNHLRYCLQEMHATDLIASNTETIVDSEDDYYVPDQHDVDNAWMKFHAKHLRSKITDYAEYENTFQKETLLNCGIIGGHTPVIQDFIEKLCLIHQQYNYDNTTANTGDMGAFNYLARTKFNNQLQHGAPVNTVFKRYENERTDCWFRHK